MFKKVLAICFMLMLGISGINTIYSATTDNNDFIIPSDNDGVRVQNINVAGVEAKQIGWGTTGIQVSAYTGNNPMLLYGIALATSAIIGTDNAVFRDTNIAADVVSSNVVCAIFLSTSGASSYQFSQSNVIMLPIPIKFKNGISVTQNSTTAGVTVFYRYLKH